MHRHHATCMQPSAHRRCASEASQCDTPRRHAVLARAEPDGAASAPADAASSPPSFTLVFEEAGGNTRTLEGVESGEILRDVMLDADPPVDLYTTWCDVEQAPCSLTLPLPETLVWWTENFGTA